MIKNSGEFKQRVKISSKVIQAISLRKAMNFHTSQGARQTKDEGLIVQNSSLDKESCFILTDDNHSSEEAIIKLIYWKYKWRGVWGGSWSFFNLLFTLLINRGRKIGPWSWNWIQHNSSLGRCFLALNNVNNPSIFIINL